MEEQNKQGEKLQSSDDDLRVWADIFFCFTKTDIQCIHKRWIKSKPNHLKNYAAVILHSYLSYEINPFTQQGLNYVITEYQQSSS